MITDLLRKDSGSIVFEERYSIKEWNKYIGLVPQELAIYFDLTAEENVQFFASLYGLKGQELKVSVNNTLQFVGLENLGKKRAGSFSGGMKRRLNIACAIAHSPKLIIMDEPTVGIDPQSRNHILENIQQLQKNGTTIMYTSHYMEEVEEICNKVLIIDKGTVIINDSIEHIESFVTTAKNNGKSKLENVFLELTGKELRD